jgi:hypothetical protein
MVLCAVAGPGCGAQYKKSVTNIAAPYERGLYAEAAANATEARVEAEKDAPRNKLILLLEEGSTSRTNSALSQSSTAFDEADKLFDVYDQKAKIQLSKEGIIALTNQANVDYEGYGYDRIMANVYTALNYLQEGRFDDARVEIKQVALAQAKCEQRYRDKIAQAKHEKDQASKEQANHQEQRDFDYEKASQDPKFQQGQQAVFADFPEVRDETPLDDLSHVRLYVNPYAEYLQGVFFLHSNAPGDREVGRVAIRNAAGMMSTNEYLQRDVSHAEQAASTNATAPRTYVIFETGMAPSREEIRIDVPVFLYNIAIHDTRVDYVGIAFPRLAKIGGNIEYLTCSTNGGGQYPTQVLADVDKIVAREFKNEFPLIITRTVISAIVKAAIQYGVAKAVEHEDQWVQFGARFATAAYAAATNEADLRTWRTLPKQVQLASFPTPQDGVVHVNLPNGTALSNVTVQPGKSALIWIRCPSYAAPSIIRQINLN